MTEVGGGNDWRESGGMCGRGAPRCVEPGVSGKVKDEEEPSVCGAEGSSSDEFCSVVATSGCVTGRGS